MACAFRPSLVTLLVLALGPVTRAEMVTVRIGSPPRGPAQNAEKARPEKPTGYVLRTDTAPRIDGTLNDEAWKKAQALDIRNTLDGQGPASKPTQIKVLHDARTLYIGVRCGEPDMGKVRAVKRAHDEGIWEDESVEIFLGRGDDYYHLGINAVGSTYDAHGKDASWESGIKAASFKGSAEWTLELAVPLKAMGANGEVPVNWIANFNRNRYASGGLEEFAWSPTYSGDSHVPARFGRLLFTEPPEPEPVAEGAKPTPTNHSVEILPCAGGEGVARFDLSAVPRGARVYRADLRVFRDKPIDGTDDAALVDIEVFPLLSPFSGGRPNAGGKPLELRGPWYECFDATDAVSQWARGKPNGGFFVKACPHWNSQATCLDVYYEGRAQNAPSQAKGLVVLHRTGQTFIVFQETDNRSAEATPPWADLKNRIDNMDAERTVRYLVFRHDRRIDASSIAQAELLAEVKPMSGYNVLGRSVDQLIKLHRTRAIDDLDFAKSLARDDYFSRYNPDMREMGEVAIQRLAVENGKPLPPGTGLFVHHPEKAGRAYYAVVSSVDGVANTRDFSAANSLSTPISETVGIGEPVLQGKPDVTVFFDYPGERLHYVQWAAPPLSNLPSQYYNWGIFIPKGYKEAGAKRLSVFFHNGKQRWLKPPWPHRQDTILISPHDAPFHSYGFGHHEALGTLRSFRQGLVKPFMAKRVDAMVAWALKEYGADEGRISCGGHGTWGGTAALQYALHRPGKIAYVMADGSPDPDPRQTPPQFSYYGRANERPRTTHRSAIEAVWGKVEWSIKSDGGRSVWEEADLAAAVRANTDKTMPYVSLGAGGMHATWKQETDLMKAYLETGNGFMSEFFWGGTDAKPLPVSAEEGDYPFEPRSDRPVLGCKPKGYHPNPGFFGPDGQFTTGKRGYGGGSRLNTRPRWDPEDIVDSEERLEMTIFSARNVTYAGTAVCDVTVRNTRKFRPKPGEKVAWKVVPEKQGQQQSGEITIGGDGLIVLPEVIFGAPARLTLERKNAD